jgi:hypothetical protein
MSTDVHGQFHPVDRQNFVVVGAVEPGGSVKGSSHPVQLTRGFGAVVAVEPLGSLEHQMLENVGRAGVTGQLVARTHPIDDPETDNRRHRGRRRQHGQPVSLVAPLCDAVFALHLFERIRQLSSSNRDV